MFVLDIPAKKMYNSFTIDYINLENNLVTKVAKKNQALNLTGIKLLIQIQNPKLFDVTTKFSMYLYDISLYNEYQSLISELKKELLEKKYNESVISVCRRIKRDSDLYNDVLLPSIEFICANKNSVFIRHGQELNRKDQYTNENVHFPLENAKCWNHGLLYVKQNKVFWSKEKQDLKKCKIAYPIEIDMLPFCIDINAYKNRKWPLDNQCGHCSNHDSLFSWNKLKGYMRYEDFIQKEGEIIDSKRRDHLYAVSNIAVKNWLFIYQNIDASTEKTKYWGWTQKNFTCLDYQTNINNLLRNKVKVLPQELVVLINKIDI